jgi:xylulose-5-phosphate/fructose-6-phosphate phosphoketolase
VAAYIKQRVRDKLVEHSEYIVQRGTDMPEVANWNWPG